MSTRGQGRLEPMPDKPLDSNSERFLYSIAVSLKRIADGMCGDDQHRGVPDILADMLHQIHGM